MKLEAVREGEFERQWNIARAGIKEALERSAEAASVDDVKSACLANMAQLVIAKEDDKELCTMVVQRRKQQLHIWTARGMLTEALVEALEDFARHLGCKRLTFDSNRKGWERTALRYGFTPRRWAKDIKWAAKSVISSTT